MSNKNPFLHGYYLTEELREMGFKYVGENVQIAKNCTIIGLENISIGDDTRIDGGVILACSNGVLKIGSYVHIAAKTCIWSAGGVTIQDFVGLSSGIKIYSASDDYSGISLTNPTIPSEFQTVINIAPVIIGRHALIGCDTVILPGVTIEEGVSVGSKTLVNKSLDAWGIYAGIPAKRLKEREKYLLVLEKKLLESRDSPLPIIE